MSTTIKELEKRVKGLENDHVSDKTIDVIYTNLKKIKKNFWTGIDLADVFCLIVVISLVSVIGMAVLNVTNKRTIQVGWDNLQWEGECVLERTEQRAEFRRTECHQDCNSDGRVYEFPLGVPGYRDEVRHAVYDYMIIRCYTKENETAGCKEMALQKVQDYSYDDCAVCDVIPIEDMHMWNETLCTKRKFTFIRYEEPPEGMEWVMD